MKCEYCTNPHDGLFGSGRFCSTKCARGFSTRSKRKEINEKVSLTVKEQVKNGLYHNHSDRLNTPEARSKRLQTIIKRFGRPWTFSDEDREKAKQSQRSICEKIYHDKTFEQLSTRQKKRRLIELRGHQCEHCRNVKWFDKLITLELDHIDGNKQNNIEGNLRLLCPNCHSYTPTWRRCKNSLI